MNILRGAEPPQTHENSGLGCLPHIQMPLECSNEIEAIGVRFLPGLQRGRETKMVQSETVNAAGAAEILDFEKVRSAKLVTQPFDYLIASSFIRPQWRAGLIADYPAIKKGGSFPLPTVKSGPEFSQLIQALDGVEFRQVVEEKFAVALGDRPTMFTVRGHCRRRDGKIHTDTESKIITVLLYMNTAWAAPGGRLRLLHSGTNIDDVAAEVSPTFGNLLIFRRCGHSFHGHLPFEGERRVIQMNWVTSQEFLNREAKRHGWTALIKKLRFAYS
jgi:hypothetical protein